MPQFAHAAVAARVSLCLMPLAVENSAVVHCTEASLAMCSTCSDAAPLLTSREECLLGSGAGIPIAKNRCI